MFTRLSSSQFYNESWTSSILRPCQLRRPSRELALIPDIWNGASTLHRFYDSRFTSHDSRFTFSLRSFLILNHIIKNLAFGIGGTLPLLAFVIWGWGDWTTFFSHPARIGVIILALAGAIAYAFSGSSGLGTGRREDPSSRWILVPVIIIAIVFAWLPRHLDHFDRWSIDGDMFGFSGLCVAAIGGIVCV